MLYLFFKVLIKATDSPFLCEEQVPVLSHVFRLHGSPFKVVPLHMGHGWEIGSFLWIEQVPVLSHVYLLQGSPFKVVPLHLGHVVGSFLWIEQVPVFSHVFRLQGSPFKVMPLHLGHGLPHPEFLLVESILGFNNLYNFLISSLYLSQQTVVTVNRQSALPRRKMSPVHLSPLTGASKSNNSSSIQIRRGIPRLPCLPVSVQR